MLRHAGAALAALAAAPVAGAGLALRRDWREGLDQRLGAAPRSDSRPMWVHGASVGEITAALRLLDALAARGVPLCASTMTRTGQAVLRRARPELPATFAPLDHPWSVARALARVRPAVLALVETELWPCWIAGAARRGIPVAVVSGRISDRSYPRYRRAGVVVARTLRRLSAVGARGEPDAARFAALGVPEARIRVTGDLKLEPPERPPAAPPEVERAVGGLPVLVAGSTHAGEEAAALDALARVEASGASTALVLAPRHLDRVPEVEALVRAAGHRVLRRSALVDAALAPGDVLLLDTHGELAGTYACGVLGFVGGSLVSRGGHNVLEPVWCGRPVVFGPHVASAATAAESLRACGAGATVADAAELADAWRAALSDPAAARRHAAAAREALGVHRGAAARSADLLMGLSEDAG